LPRSHADLPDPWRRSLRRSQERRAMLRRRRLRRTRGRGVAVMVGVLMAGASSAALGARGEISADGTARAVLAPGDRGADVATVQRALGMPGSGRFDARTRRAVRVFQARHRLVVDGLVGPRTRAALGIRDRQPEAAEATAAARAVLDRIAMCESGGDPRAVSPDGRYRGKYQFDRVTWRGMGGRGDPAAAPERAQDRVAARALARRGPAAWPNCA
jgi:Transglycosylase-like domain/Putative peptidoglycan binding domain